MPKGEIAFVRQVLQHLSNNSIKKFIDNVNKFKPYKYILITEHISDSNILIKNIDKPLVHVCELVLIGVFVHEKPFFLKSSSFEVLLIYQLILKILIIKIAKMLIH